MSDLLKRIAELSLLGFQVSFRWNDEEGMYVLGIRYFDANGRGKTFEHRFALDKFTDEEVLATIDKALTALPKEGMVREDEYQLS